MRGTHNELFSDIATNGLLGIGPRLSTALTAGAILTASYAMGATWLGSSIALLPVGTWLLAGSVVGAHVIAKRQSRYRSAPTGHMRTPDSSNVDHARASLNAPALFSAAAAEMKALSETGARSASRHIRRLTDRLVRAELVIGLDLPRREMDAFTSPVASKFHCVAGTHVTWTKAEPGLMTDGHLDAARYDALLRRGADGRLAIFVPTHDSDKADISDDLPDTACPDALSYATVFPSRLDGTEVQLGAQSLSRSADAALIAALTMVVAALARSVRAQSSTLALAVGSFPNESLVVCESMTLLSEALVQCQASPDHATPAMIASAKYLSTYAATSPHHIPDAERVHMAHTALDAIPEDPALSLRLGAALFAAGQVNDAKQAMVRGLRRLRATRARCDSDPLAFVMSEAEHGTSESLTVGRMCAGIALAWGTAQGTSLDYLRDDLIDDLKYAGWLAGREDDVRMLRECIAELENELLSVRSTCAQPPRTTTKRPSRKKKAA